METDDEPEERADEPLVRGDKPQELQVAVETENMADTCPSQR